MEAEERRERRLSEERKPRSQGDKAVQAVLKATDSLSLYLLASLLSRVLGVVDSLSHLGVCSLEGLPDLGGERLLLLAASLSWGEEDRGGREGEAVRGGGRHVYMSSSRHPRLTCWGVP